MAGFYTEMRRSVEQVDGVTDAFAKGLVADLEATFGKTGQWDIDDLPKIQDVVDGHIATTYGSSRALATRSALYRTIYSRVLFVADSQYNAFFREFDAWMKRESPVRWPMVRKAIEESGDPLSGVFMSIKGKPPAAERRRRARMVDPQRRWVQPGGYRLSDRVWMTGQKQRKQIDKIIRTGVRRGEGVSTVSRRLNRYLLPSNSPVVYKRGGQIVRRKQGTGGGGAHSSRRLVRTELQHVNATATRDSTSMLADKIPGVGITYKLSIRHPKFDRCDIHAGGSDPGFPQGTYLVNNVPRIPDHPQCICHYQPFTPGSEEVIDYLEAEFGGEADGFW